MLTTYGHWIGLGGVSPHDGPEAHHWERRLHWLMALVALLAVPAFFLEHLAASLHLQAVGLSIDLIILLAFAAELGWMMHVSSQPWVYLRRNWLNVVIILAAGANLLGVTSEWVVLARLLRLGLAGLLLTRALIALRGLLSPHSLPFVLAFGVVTLLISGAGFYWLEPTVHTYGEGVWLAFVTGATVGYGDVVPTTPAARVFAAVIVVLSLGVLSIVTATIAAFFVGEDEKQLRREFHHDIKALRDEVRSLRAQLQAAGIIGAAPPGIEHPGQERHPPGVHHGPESGGTGPGRPG